MPKRLLLVVAFVVSGTVALGYILAAENSSRFAWQSEPGPAQSASVETIPEPSQPSAAPSRPGGPSPEAPGEDALGFMLASAAQEYTQNIRYPAYSTPITEAQAEGYEGNRFEPIALPLNGDGRFTVTLEKFRFVEDEDILVAATVTGQQVVSDRMKVTLESAGSRSPEAAAELTRDGNEFFQGVISAGGSPGEYRLIVEARIDSKPVRHVSTLTIEPDLGEFDGIGTPDIRGNDLVIPVHFDARESGFYSLSAQLFNSGQPIALLTTEKRLEGAGSTLDLRAHGTVLANIDVDGDLQLRHLQIRRLPAQPGDRTDYGFGPDQGYSFSPPDLGSLTDTPASDPESEQRAALLQKLADKF